MNLLLLIVCAFGAAHVEEDSTTNLNRLLDGALATAWKVDDPRAPVRQVVLTMLKIDPQRALAPTRTAARRLAGLMQVKPQVDNIFAPLAEAVARHDSALRDELLALAISSAQESLACDELWATPDEGAGRGRGGVPTRRELLQRERLRLELSTQLWQIIRDHAAGEADFAARMTNLLAAARAEGGYHACAWITYEDLLIAELVQLDTRLSLAVLREEWGDAKLSKLCENTGRHRWMDGDRGELTKHMIEIAVEHGHWRCLDIFAEFNAERAWEVVQTTPMPKNDASNVRHNILRHFAWNNLDAALAIAEAEQDVDERRDLVTLVAEIWARRRPDSVERALRELDNEVRRSWVREAAEEETESRARGNLPSTKEYVLNYEYRYVPAEPTFVRRSPLSPRSNNPEEVRILENPRDTTWLVGFKRQIYLNQAAAIIYHETDSVDAVREFVAHYTDADERHHAFQYVADSMVGYGKFESAAKLLQHIDDPRRRVYATCSIVNFATRP